MGPNPQRRVSNGFAIATNSDFEKYIHIEKYLEGFGVLFAYSSSDIIVVIDTTIIKHYTDLKTFDKTFTKMNMDLKVEQTAHATYKKSLRIGLDIVKKLHG